MKTAAQIKFDFESAKARASELDEAANVLQRVCVKGMEDALADLSQGWRGENARQFIAKVAAQKENAGKTVTYLRAIASLVRKNAQILYDAEMTALRIAQSNA